MLLSEYVESLKHQATYKKSPAPQVAL